MNKRTIVEQLSQAGVPAGHHETFVTFQTQCAGIVGGYGLNRWIWGIMHDVTEWLPAHELSIDFDEDEALWFAQCSEGHLSDDWSIDHHGAIYWCGQRKADHYMEAVEHYRIDYKQVIAILDAENIQTSLKIQYLSKERHILNKLLHDAPNEVHARIAAFLAEHS